MTTVSTLIRPAEINDFEWVADLMHTSLEPYYGGDHRAHAKRILDAHIDGGHDRVGFFSFEQKMFILEVENKRAGILHLVGKRQSTYKISPLILAPEFQGIGGLGTTLLDYAENHAREHEARQLYCTVAEKNNLAMQFFLRKGFIRAGSSDSHYKNDITETMLYKPLHGESKILSLDQIHVSVLPLEKVDPKAKEEVAKLLLEKLPNSFEGITDEWVTALFNGYERRNTSDINLKYKLIFVALDSDGCVIGVAGATPKKGSPIKIMPFIATNTVAFEALLIDIPHQLVLYGHKLYTHINPTPEEVVSLQRLGWKLDAALPNAYYLGVTTQQWSINIKETLMRTLRIKQRFFNLIKSGKKTLEVRVGYDTINHIQSGEQINLVTHTSQLSVRVSAIRRYSNFKEMLLSEKFSSIAPDVSSSEELLTLLKNIYPPHKEQLGVVVFEIKK
jgi:ASC-1-like (ASCH) protein/ribosomal protein S18 acetylase RimI-like enzyme